MQHHERTSAILRSKLPSTLRFVLVAIAHHTNDLGECWPGTDVLSDETGYSTRTVRRAREELAELGVLVVDREARRSLTYRIDFEAVAAYVPTGDTRSAQEDPVSPHAEGTDDPLEGTQCPQGGTQCPPNDPRTDQERSNPPTPQGGIPGIDREPFGLVFDRWLELWRRQNPTSTKRKPTTKEARTIRARLNEPDTTTADVIAMLDWVEYGRDKWAQGLRGERAFREGEEAQAYLGIETLFKPSRWSDRIQAGLKFRTSTPTPTATAKRWTLRTAAEVDAALANGLGDWFRDTRQRLGGDRLAIDRAFEEVAGGPFARFDEVYTRWSNAERRRLEAAT